MHCDYVLCNLVLFVVMVATSTAQKPCEGGGEKNCTGKEKWCLVDENGGVHEKCRDLDCSSSRFSCWFQCQGDTTLACHKSPTEDQCICSCVKNFCDRNEGQKCSGKTKWCFNETAGFTEMCGESGCDASKSHWKVCKTPGTEMSCEKTSDSDACHCTCVEKVCSNQQGNRCTSNKMKWCMISDKGRYTDSCNDRNCHPSTLPWKICYRRDYKPSCRKTTLGTCLCTCVKG
ncbi:uncharacterized protein LOC119167583 [Rhipicephalus microplus]|uniref:uncharacterized protein LOC119167583 n=1 Tax=Rhipicephalus microplus TaxID=6941 RepID=UPI003F6B8898